MLKKEPIYISARCNGYDTICYIDIPTTTDKKDYEKYIVIRNVIGKGRTQELMKIPFVDIVDITYHKPFLFGICTMDIQTKTNIELVRDIKIDRDFFDKSIIKKMIKIIKNL